MIALSVPPQVPPHAVGRQVDRVFAQPAYDRSATHSLLLDIVRWLLEKFARLVLAINQSPTAAFIIKYTMLALAAIVVAAIAYRLFRHYRATRGDAAVRFGSGNAADLWKEAERAASHGDYTEAAHLLYAALVRTMVVRGAVRFHPSKTTGDYLRELRRRGGATAGPLLSPFTEFVRAYEVVVYRDGTCDAERYGTLRALADPVVRPQRAAA